MITLSFLFFSTYLLITNGQTYSNVSMSFNMLTTWDQSPAVTGQSLNFQVLITLSASGSYTDFNLEIATPSDATNHSMTRLCDVYVTATDTGTSTSYLPATKISPDNTKAYNDLIYSMSSILSSGAAVVQADFTMIAIDPPSVTDTQSIYVQADIYLGDEVLVGEFPMSVLGGDTWTSYQQTCDTPTITGPATMKINETAVFTVAVAMDKIKPNVTLDVSWSHATLKTGLSVTSIRLATWGTYWLCVEDPPYLNYPSTFTPNQDIVGNQRATLYMGVMCNVGSRSDNIYSANNTLTFEFTLHVYGHDQRILNEAFTLTTQVTVDGIVEASNTAPLTVAGIQGSTSLVAAPPVLNVTYPVSTPAIGDLVSLFVNITLPQNTINDYKVLFAVDPALTPYQISTCYVQLTWKGFNIPYVLEKPQLTDVQYTYSGTTTTDQQSSSGVMLDLGFVANTGQILNNGTEDSMIFLITFQILNDPSNVVSATVATNLYFVYNAGTENQMNAQSWTLSTPISNTAVFPSLNLTFGSGSGTSMRQQRLAYFVTGSFGTNVTSVGPTVQFEASVPALSYSVCELRVTYAGTNLPCAKYLVQRRDQITAYFSSDDALLDMGRLCLIAYDLNDLQANDFTVRAVAEPPLLLSSGSYSFSLDGMVDGFTSTGFGSLSAIHIDTPVAFSSSVLIFADLVTSVLGQISDNEVAPLSVRIKFPPAEAGPYSLTVTATNDLSVCGLEVYYEGDNIPCHGVGTVHTPLISGQTLSLDMGVVTNVGYSSTLSSLNIDDDDALTLSVAVIAKNVIASTASSVTITDSLGNTVAVTVQEQPAASSYFGSPPRLVYLGGAFENSTDIVAGVVYHYKLEVVVPEGSRNPLLLQISGPTNVNGDTIRICSARVTSIGENLPCLTDTIVPVYQQLSGSSYDNSVTLDLGFVCQTKMSKYPTSSSNTFDVEFAFEVVQTSLLTVGSTFQLTASSQNQSLTVGLNLVSGPALFINPMNLGGLLPSVNVDVTPVPIRPGEYFTFPFNVSFPANNTQLTQLQLLSQVVNGTATLHISNLSIVNFGVNIPCLSSFITLPAYQSTVTPPNVYMDNSTLILGWLTNTGETYRTRAGGLAEDDIVSFEATVFMTDNALSVSNQLWPIDIILTSGTNVTNGTQYFSVLRYFNETPVINRTMDLISNQSTYVIGDQFSTHFALSHLIDSNTEPLSIGLTFYLPASVTFLGAQPNNYTQLVITTGSQLVQLSYPRLLFFDQLDIGLNFQLSSFTGIAYTPFITTVIPYQLEFYTLNRVTNALPLIRQTYPISDMRFNTSVTACNQALISPLSVCQMAASSTKASLSVDQVKYGSASYWSPEFRLNENPWLRFAFNGSTQISLIRVASQSSIYRRPTSISLSVSYDGSKWIPSTTVNLSYINEEAQFSFNTPLSVEYLQLTILAADDMVNAERKYVGLQVELYGCYSGSMAAVTNCLGSSTTGTTYDRQFVAMGDPAAMFCFYNFKTSSRQCFVTPDGDMWINPGPSVAYILGYDSSTASVFGSNNNRNVTMVSRDAGLTWTPVTVAEFNTASALASFAYPKSIPYNSIDESPFSDAALAMGTWGAGFRGLYKVSGSTWSQDPRVTWISGSQF